MEINDSLCDTMEENLSVLYPLHWVPSSRLNSVRCDFSLNRVLKDVFMWVYP